MRPPPSMLRAAHRIVQRRRRAYGHPKQDFSRSAKIWSAILGVSVTPQQVALCMIGVKLSRECYRHRRDNCMDIAGYAETLHMLGEYKDASGVKR